MVIPPKRPVATITASKDLSEGVKWFRLGLSEPIDFVPGQYVDLRFPGEKRYHAFSIASSPSIKGEVELVVKREHEFTTRMFGSPDGTQLECIAPLGQFMQEFDGDIVMIAGGIGVTPFLSMVRNARDTHDASKNYWLFYSARNRAALAFEEELRQLHDENEHINIVFTLTREQPEGWDNELGHFNKDMLLKHLENFDNKTFCTCGPDKMVEAMIGMLTEAGVPEDKILHESWG